MFASLLAASLFAAAPSQQLADPAGLLRVETGELSAPLKGELARAARQFALERAAGLGVSEGSTLEEGRVHAHGNGATVRFRQLVNGVPVHAAVVTVSVDAAGRVFAISSSARPFTSVQSRFALPPEDALLAASAAVPLARVRSDGQPIGAAAKRFFQVGSELRATYEFHVPTLSPAANHFAFIDAESGDVLRLENRVYFATDDAQAWSSSPGSAGNLPLGTLSLSPWFGANRDGGWLTGRQLTAYGCCPSEGCVVGAPPKRSTGYVQGQTGVVPYDMAVCDRIQRANNELNPSGNYVYAPSDPVPFGAAVSQNVAADSDPFSEVHGFIQVNRAYDWIRSLSTSPYASDAGVAPFRMRPSAGEQLPMVWTNVTLPNDGAAYAADGGYRSDTLVRQNNAVFIPSESPSFVYSSPAYDLTVDTLLFFQSNADYAYDGPVLWHEFGHGVIHSTANIDFGAWAFDGYSSNNEGGALHEGIADFFAAAFGQNPEIGVYVAPRNTGGVSIRNLQNTLRAPDVLVGEVHEDSQHFAAALWQARQELFFAPQNGAVFDAAVFAALTNMTPRADFAQAAALVAAHVGAAFPQNPQAAQLMNNVFRARGVIGSDKALDVTTTGTPRAYYAIGAPSNLFLQPGSKIPGPIQFKVDAPAGASQLVVSFSARFVYPTVIAKPGAAVQFSVSNGTMVHDGPYEAVSVRPTSGGRTATLPIDVGCNDSVYFTIANTAGFGIELTNLRYTLTSKDLSCPAPDAGSPDAGVELDAGSEVDAGLDVDAGTELDAGLEGDAGTELDAGLEVEDAGAIAAASGEADAGYTAVPGNPEPPTGTLKSGCGCGASTPLASLLFGAPLALFGLRRRRSR